MLWDDKNGLTQMLNPGRAFVPDPAAMKAEVSAGRQASLEKAATAAEPMLERRETMRANRQAVKNAARQRIEATRREVGAEYAGE